jgi:hypothetical protein
MIRVHAFAAALALAACRAPAPPPRCQATSLAGLWHDAEDPSYAYRVEDLGSRVLARPIVAGGGAEPAGGGGTLVELRRGPSDLGGVVRQTGRFAFPDGTSRTCTVEFAARVLACPPGHLEIEVEQSGAVDPDCRRIAEGAPDLARHTWVRD